MWEVQDDKRVRRLSARAVAAQLRDGGLTGAELAREDEGPWVRLYDTPLFAEAVPADASPRSVALRRASHSLLTHALVFLVAMAYLGFPAWGLWWGIGLVAHAAKDVPLILAAWRAPAETRAAAGATAAALPGPVGADPVSRAVAAVLEGVAPDDALRAELVKVAASAAALHRREAALAEALAGGDAATLRAALEAVAARAEAGDRAAAVERDALAGRVDAAEAAQIRLEEVRAQLRAAEHAVAGVRLRLAAADEATVAAELRTLRRRVEAELEVAAVAPG